MSNSFYGGKQGFGFILKGNEDADDHFFHNEEEILAAVANKKLRYGEYALISFPDESNVDKIGNLYRVVHGNIELVANISGPAGAAGAQGIQGPPGEKGEKGDAGAGFIYMEHEADMYVPTSTTVRFNEIETGRNIRVTNNITVGFDGDDDEYGNAVHFFGSTGIYRLAYDNNFFQGQAITQAVDLWNYSLDTYYYDISKLYTLPDGPVLDIYEGGRLPPLIYFRGIEVHEGTGAEPMPEGLYMIIRYNNSLVMWPVLWGPDTNSWSNAITINTTDATKKIIKLKMVKGANNYTDGPPMMIFLGYVDNTNVKFCAGVASRALNSEATCTQDRGTRCYQDGSLRYEGEILPHGLFAADNNNSSWDSMRAFANWMGGGASLVIQLDGENTTVTYG